MTDDTHVLGVVALDQFGTFSENIYGVRTQFVELNANIISLGIWAISPWLPVCTELILVGARENHLSSERDDRSDVLLP
jgi:hypothetical protein